MLQLDFINVGNGDSILIREMEGTRQRFAMLVDCGHDNLVRDDHPPVEDLVFWLPGAAAGSLLHVFRRLEKRTDGMGHERILAGLVRIIVRHVKLRKNYKNDSYYSVGGGCSIMRDRSGRSTGR